MAGTSILGRYRFISRLGAGGSSTVVLAEDTLLGRRVALKRIHAPDDIAARSRLRREALVGASLGHPNLVAIFDIATTEDGDDVIVMEYVEGETLADRLRRDDKPDTSEALRILDGVSAALDAIHRRRIIHRDVKPANVLLGVEGAVKLADLGIAAVPDGTQITTGDAVLGTFRYMAPEQLEGTRATPAVDIYALAAMAYEALSGTKARHEPNPLALAHAIATQPPPDLRNAWPEASAGAAEVLIRGMSRDPKARPRSAGELIARLRASIEPHTTQAGAAATYGAEGGALAGAALAGEAAAREAPTRPAAARSAAARPAAPVPVPVPQPQPAAAQAKPAAAKPKPAAAQPQPAAAQKSPAAARQTPAAAQRKTPTGNGASGAGNGAGGAALARSGGVPARVREPESAAARAAPARRRTGVVAAAATALAALAVVLIVLANSGTGHPRTTANRAPARAHASQTTTKPKHKAAHQSASTAAGTSGPAATSVAPAATPANTPTPASAAAGSPVAAVESFYHLAAAHQFSAAWALADPAFRQQLQGLTGLEGTMSRVRSVTFDAANVVSQSATTAVVAVRTTSVQDSGTQHCSGTVALVRGASTAPGWLLDRISIRCT